MSDPVPAIREADATGEAAAIFADIRAVFGVGVVNLVWRHLATFPGGLEWAWGNLRPVYVSGHARAAAGRFRAALPLPVLPVIPPEALVAVGVTADAPIRAILEAYNRTNPMALVALTLLQMGPAAVPAPPLAQFPEENRAVPLPPLQAMAEFPEETQALVWRLNGIGAGPDPILASMYRHLAPWPGYLALAWALLAPLDVSAIIARGQEAARVEAERLRGLLAPVPPPADMPAVLGTLRAFTQDAIGRMVPICAMLRAATPCQGSA